MHIYIYIYYLLYVTNYILPIECPSIASMHICSAIMDMGPGRRTNAQKLLGRGLGARSFWALGRGPGPISIMAEHMCISGNQ